MSSLGVLLIGGGHERAHYALVVATTAAALGRNTVLFATNQGCRALLPDPGWGEVARPPEVASFDELREAAMALGVRLLACETGLAIAGIDAAALSPTVEVVGVATFLAATEGGQIVTL